MPRVVSNATPLIYLAKADKIDLLKAVFGEVLIPEEVKVEVVDKGKLIGEKDAYAVEKAIAEGWIKVLAAKPVRMPLDLDRGEKAALSLAKNNGSEIVLIDEVSARTVAKVMGLTPRGTLFVLLEALKMKKIQLDELLEALDNMIKQGFRLKEEVYVETVREARRIAGELKE